MKDERTTTGDQRPTTGDQRRERDWTGEEWAGEPPTEEQPADAVTGKDAHWNKTEWAGDQGSGMPSPIDPAIMPEGETSISGDRHPSGEQHWVPDAGDASKKAGTGTKQG